MIEESVLRDCIAALAQHGSKMAAARAMGMPRVTFKRMLIRAAQRGIVGVPVAPPEGFAVKTNNAAYDADGKLLRQWVGTAREPGDEYTVPAGHTVKGESALLDPDGRVLAKWVKTRESGAGEGLVEALRTAFAGYAGAAAPIDPPAAGDDDLLTVYPMPDLHLGMHAWGKEAGANYDVRIASDLAVQSVGDLVAQSRPSRKAVLLGLGDYFHSNDHTAATPRSGHRLDVDGRWPKVYAAGAALAVRLVDLVARKHAEVEVVFLPGNHDLDAAVTLTVALALFYQQSPHIAVHQEPGAVWYRRFGSVLLGATHGDTMKPDRMAMMLAADRAADWGETKHRHFFFGHIHHETAREIGPVRVESFASPAARDAFNAASGYRAGRAYSALTFDRHRGEVGRHRVNIVV